jgi:hypothetical protein
MPRVQPNDLWRAFGNASGIADLETYMDGYTSQIGYPLVTLAWINADGLTTGSGSLEVRGYFLWVCMTSVWFPVNGGDIACSYQSASSECLHGFLS